MLRVGVCEPVRRNALRFMSKSGFEVFLIRTTHYGGRCAPDRALETVQAKGQSLFKPMNFMLNYT